VGVAAELDAHGSGRGGGWQWWEREESTATTSSSNGGSRHNLRKQRRIQITNSATTRGLPLLLPPHANGNNGSHDRNLTESRPLKFDTSNEREMSEEGGSGGTGSAWKSRFPVARIKKIMQADEDVGKVAQVTPVAICTLLSTPLALKRRMLTMMIIAKALELFMDRMIKAVADETKARGARKVTPSHLYPQSPPPPDISQPPVLEGCQLTRWVVNKSSPLKDNMISSKV
jgi:Histone-like transcription factor (CBF/NF-Y) and archaeal histone